MTDLKDHQKTLTYHRYAEALKFANSFKKHIRDPKFSSDDVKLSLRLWHPIISIIMTINIASLRKMRALLILRVHLTDGQKIPGGQFFQTHPEFDQEQCYPRSTVLQHHAICGRHGHHTGVGAGRGRLGRVRHQQHQPHVSIPGGDVQRRWNFTIFR